MQNVNCPKCDSENTESQEITADGPDYFCMEWSCDDCDTLWAQDYAVEYTPTEARVIEPSKAA